MNENNRWHNFAELGWLENIIAFIFNLAAKLSELFLAFGLVASAVDYGTHGAFLSNQRIMMTWIVTQAIALEGSGGVALDLSFEAKAQNDVLKSRLQLALSVALLIVGGVMFFVEIGGGVKGFKEADLPDWYVWTMAALRALVSLGYIAMMRTKRRRFSGEEPAQVQQRSVAEQVQAFIEQTKRSLNTELESLKNAVHSAVQSMNNDVHLELQSMKNQMQQTVQVLVNTEQPQPQRAFIVEHIEPMLRELEDRQMTALDQVDARFSELRKELQLALRSTTVTEVQSAPAIAERSGSPKTTTRTEHGGSLNSAVQSRSVNHVATEPTLNTSVQTERSEPAQMNSEGSLNAVVGSKRSLDFSVVVPAFIDQFKEVQGRLPTIGELREQVGCSQGTASNYLKQRRG